MLEVEMKFPVQDLEQFQKHLHDLGAQFHAARTEADHYFNAPDRDFARTDEALRLRRIGEKNYLTYKGPKLDAQTKTRKEIEVPVEGRDNAAGQIVELLTSLGFRSVAIIRKQRRIYQLKYDDRSVEICLDQVDGLGTFVELETIVEDQHVVAARQQVQELARQLGLSGGERRSYLELWLEKHQVTHHAS